ncbi:MAG: DJ-1/PfpI family protein [Candidatus Xenobia bacterium]
MGDLKGRKVLFVVPPGRFKDDEYTKAKGMLERKGVSLQITCSVFDRAVFGFNQTRVKADLPLEQVDVANYDAFYFVGGVGVKDLYDNAQVHRIIKDAVAADKFLVALDLAPTLLAKTGVLAGKKVTEYFSESKMIQTMGVEYTGATVQQDGKFITGKGAEATENLAMTLIKAMEG